MRLPLKQLLLANAAIVLVAVVIPCVFLPATAFAWVGLDLGESAAALLFVRALGAASTALVVLFALPVVQPASMGAARIAALADNIASAAVLWTMTFRGSLAALPVRGKAGVIVIAAAASLMAVLLLLARSRPPEPPGLSAALKPPESKPATPDEASTESKSS